ncbi:serine hydrolase domain-containing protein [Rhodococcus sp. P1Y]|uniref:serine hydrolase domain-containing protein n=1 Tax=Rhodococcus sp. P1Y TaxID=1302308 RepID=UPI001F45A6D6|nr:serine hydrolase domain-containing protein [Rhodococcus sp. P1Y]
MNLRSAVLPLALAVVVGVAACSTEQSTDAAPSTSTSTSTSSSPGTIRTADGQAVVDQLVAAGAPAAVIELRDGDAEWQGSAGVVDRSDDARASADDPVRIASITKSMVAAVVLQLVDERRLTLETDVDEILPGLLPKAVTIRQLLNHTSGLPNYLDSLVPPDAQGLVDAADNTYTDAQLIDIALAEPWPLEPGAEFSYSNTNYVVLGEIVAALDDRSLADSLRTRVFEPLGMNSTTYPTAADMPGGGLHGYIVEGGTYSDITDFDPSIWSASAAVVSTVGDVNTFFRGLFDETMLPRELVTEMQQVTPSGYGLGLLVGGDACNPGAAELVFGQRGNGFGYRTLSFSTPDGGRQVTLGWTASAIDPASDPLEQTALNGLITGLAATCPA